MTQRCAVGAVMGHIAMDQIVVKLDICVFCAKSISADGIGKELSVLDVVMMFAGYVQKDERIIVVNVYQRSKNINGKRKKNVIIEAGELILFCKRVLIDFFHIVRNYCEISSRL